jgi:hypothetical protein
MLPPVSVPTETSAPSAFTEASPVSSGASLGAPSTLASAIRALPSGGNREKRKSSPKTDVHPALPNVVIATQLAMKSWRRAAPITFRYTFDATSDISSP